MGNTPKRKKRKQKPISVAIGYCHPEKVSAFWHTSLVGLLQREVHRVVSVISVLSGPKVDSARNEIVRRWLNETKADYLFMVDTDMILPPDTIDVLIRHNKDVVGGLCFTGMGDLSKLTPTIRIINEKGLDVLWEYPRNSLVQVAATGGACILIKRQVAEEMLKARGEDHPLPWFAHGVHNGVEIGEDVAFCLTAGKLGYEVWVDTGLVIPHVKPRFLAEEEYALSLSRDDHPHYDDRDSVPIYQELFNGDSS